MVINKLHVSSLVVWWEQENNKRTQHKYNEIDGNEMKAALVGVKNKWYEIVQRDTKFIEDFFRMLEGKNKNYEKAKEMWLELKRMQNA